MAPVAPALPGLHIIANLSSHTPALLLQHQPFRLFIDELIARLHLTKVGEAYHDFAGGGFTGVVCLTESHLSVHTWPEFGYITFDVFLSNYLRDNRATTEAVYDAVKTFFEATVVMEQSINR